MLKVHRTRAFRSFQRTVGDSTHHINTAHVALELIARGAQKPSDLRVKWTAPKNPKDAAARSRAFLFQALLGHLFNAVDTYLRDLAVDRWVKLTNIQRDILNKSVTKPKGEAYSVADRFAELSEGSPIHDSANALLVNALVKWRNLNVHEEAEAEQEKDGEKTKNRGLDREQERKLLACAEELRAYGDLDISLLLKHMKANRAPSRKDIVALASAAQNYVRSVDELLLFNSVTETEDVERIALTEIKQVLLNADDQPLKLPWGKDVDARSRRFTAILADAGFSSTQGHLHPLRTHYVQELAGLSLAEIRDLLEDVSLDLPGVGCSAPND